MFMLQVKADQTGAEPGWMCGVCNGREGFFPEAYVQLHNSDAGATIETQQQVQSPSQTNEFPVTEFVNR